MLYRFKIKLTLKKMNLFFYITFSAAVIVMMAATTLFLYKNFYQTIAQSEEIIILQGKLSIENVDINKFEEVMEKMEKKTAPRQIGEINDPF